MSVRDSIRKVVVSCDCGCSMVLIWHFDQWGDDPEQVIVEFFPSVYEHRWRHRLRVAWRVFRGKDPWLHSVVLQNDGIAEMQRAFAPFQPTPNVRRAR